MDFIEKIQDIANRIPRQLDAVQTEEATKTAFIMPFIQCLGYDPFNPLEIVPEFTADVGTKKGEKVDYAIKKDDNIIMLIECKWCGSVIDKEQISQLFRYFSVTEARFAILTNGIVYQFYSDIDESNKMDNRPFFTFDFLNFDDHQVAELKKFTKSSFDLDNILETASHLKYTNSIKKLFAEEMADPSEELTRYFTAHVYSGNKTQAVINQFKPVVKDALGQFIREKVNERLQTALNSFPDEPADNEGDSQLVDKSTDSDSGIVTTEEEIDGFNIVKAIVCQVVDPKRVFIRDTKGYCGVILDNTNRKPICRLHFNSSQKYLGIIRNKKEEKVPIDELDEIFKFSDRLKSTVNEYISADLQKPTVE